MPRRRAVTDETQARDAATRARPAADARPPARAGDATRRLPAATERPSRVIIEDVRPEIDGGRFPVKRVAGESVTVEASVYADGHDVLRCALLHRVAGAPAWTSTEMEPLVNDRWRGSFTVDACGSYEYTVRAWVDPFRTWRRDLEKRLAAGQDVAVELQAGARLVRAAADEAPPQQAMTLRSAATAMEGSRVTAAAAAALGRPLAAAMERFGTVEEAAAYARELPVWVDRPRARFGAWYELFPRSCARTLGTHGTFDDVIARLPYVASMGFDVLYLPPIHPIGRINRKGPDGAPSTSDADPGSPWAIGSDEGGHTAIHPQLGTRQDFRKLLAAAAAHHLEIALDIAFQCAPDHPYVREHPNWFRRRPDGSIRYAENPPKKYEDIFPLDFACADWRRLWAELLGVVMHWADEGVRIFRVDNPHTKPMRFWEWLIAEVRSSYPETIFLSEAFTRPSVMHQLAKVGFTQSYTYFTWRNTRSEIEEYFRELTQTDLAEYFRPNLWPNTPDILPGYLQHGGQPAFKARLILAATLGASYGIYGPPFELCVAAPRELDSEEYARSEKYEIRSWDLETETSLRELIARVNAIRREYPALQTNEGLRFHETSNEQLVCYSKRAAEHDTTVLVVVNLDPHHVQSGWVRFPAADAGVDAGASFQAHDMLSGARYLWQGDDHYVELDPHAMPAHVCAVRKKARSERDFDYYN